jgi:hypothetical protein
MRMGYEWFVVWMMFLALILFSVVLALILWGPEIIEYLG